MGTLRVSRLQTGQRCSVVNWEEVRDPITLLLPCQTGPTFHLRRNICFKLLYLSPSRLLPWHFPFFQPRIQGVNLVRIGSQMVFVNQCGIMFLLLLPTWHLMFLGNCFLTYFLIMRMRGRMVSQGQFQSFRRKSPNLFHLIRYRGCKYLMLRFLTGRGRWGNITSNMPTSYRILQGRVTYVHHGNSPKLLPVILCLLSLLSRLYLASGLRAITLPYQGGRFSWLHPPFFVLINRPILGIIVSFSVPLE